MAIRYTDAEIDAMIRESKPLPNDYRTRLQVRPKRGHSERELDIVGDHGTRFQLILRQASLNLWLFRNSYGAKSVVFEAFGHEV